MAQGPTSLSLSGSKVAQGTPDRDFVFYSFVFFVFFFFRIKKCSEWDFTIKVNVKKQQRRFDRSTVIFKLKDNILTCANIYLSNAHAFCTYYGVIGRLLTTWRNSRIANYRPSLFISIVIAELRVVNRFSLRGFQSTFGEPVALVVQATVTAFGSWGTCGSPLKFVRTFLVRPSFAFSFPWPPSRGFMLGFCH